MSSTATLTDAPATVPLDLARRLATPAQSRRAETVAALRETLIATVAAEDPDLSLRQLTTLLILVTEPGPHHVRDLAKRMQVSKPAITRAMDRLAHLDLARRCDNPLDRRTPRLEPTMAGRAYVRTLGGTLTAALEG